MGLSFVSLGLFAAYVLIKVFKCFVFGSVQTLFKADAGHGFDGSFIALLGRVRPRTSAPICPAKTTTDTKSTTSMTSLGPRSSTEMAGRRE